MASRNRLQVECSVVSYLYLVCVISESPSSLIPAHLAALTLTNKCARRNTIYLDLGGVEVHGDDVVGSGHGQHVGYQLGGDGSSALEKSSTDVTSDRVYLLYTTAGE